MGFARALQLCLEDMPAESARLRGLRDRLFAGLTAALSGVALNGPALDLPELRLPGNLNVSFAGVDGEALLLHMRDMAPSSGSACTSAHPEPSHVLRGLGLDDERVRGSVRFWPGTIQHGRGGRVCHRQIAETLTNLRQMSSVAS